MLKNRKKKILLSENYLAKRDMSVEVAKETTKLIQDSSAYVSKGSSIMDETSKNLEAVSERASNVIIISREMSSQAEELNDILKKFKLKESIN